MKAIINRGISGSGKSTSIKNNPGYRVISKDLIRQHLVDFPEDTNFWDTYHFDKLTEQTVHDQMYNDIKKAADEGVNIILDNTNLSNKKTDGFVTMLKRSSFDVILNNCNYTDNINDYIYNNEHRLHTVPNRAINDQYIFASINKLVPLKSNKILLVDVDGTLSRATNRGIFDYGMAHTDEPIPYTINLINHLYNTGYVDYIQFLTGRESYSYDVTRSWLNAQGFDMNTHRLLCRRTKDYRKDSIIKEEIYENCLKQNTILGLFDDRPQVVSMWWDKKLPVFHVGDFRNQF